MRSSKSLADLMLVLGLAAALTGAGALLGVTDRLYSFFLMAHGALFLLLLSCGMVWYFWRRLRERQVELEMLQALEAEFLAAREEAEKASRMKDEFLTNVSHELRTPLNGVLGMINLLRLSDLNDDQREYCDLALESAEQQLSVIEDLIDFSRMETGKLMLSRKQFAPERLVESVVESFQDRARDKGLELVLNIPGSVPSTVFGDDGRLRQILANLVENGIKYTETGGIRVTLSAECSGVSREGACLFTFEVADTGIGIPEDKQAIIFDKFTQGDSSLSRVHGGSGLGLTIVRSLAELMHGQVRLDSSLGKGSTFTLTVPLELGRESYSHAQVLEGDREESYFKGWRVLVVAGKEGGESSLSEILRRQGHTVSLVVSGAEAVALLEREPFDCVFLNLPVPDGDGVETARRIRWGEFSPVDPAVPIIGLTAGAQGSASTLCFEAGMDACMARSTDPEEIMAEMVRLLNRGEA
ncbi:ATP-binding protein [Salidesulfovibrio onnuriiensis]|uniref:ATP-binding protein n=1 Tax=Salidesulfovibrio onnuriiensis TaxID=2583823 RepID=UPI0011CB3C61|nr:ATP-binding protein [Salidesulfovibrio onnuriiensis]